jgi:hypothetical protein
MERVQRERDEESVSLHGEEPAAPAAVQAGSLAWASAVGNQAVQRLARQADEELEVDPGEVEAEEAEPPEVAAMSEAGIGAAEAAGLEAADDLAEDELPG